MIDRRRVEAMVRAALAEELGPDAARTAVVDTAGALLIPPDRGVNLGTPLDRGALDALLASTPARIAVGRAGARYRTSTLLRFRADHAAARDAVMSEVDPRLLERLGLFEVRTRAEDKRQYLARPDLGRALADAARDEIARRCPRAPQLQIVYGDGLSSAALNEHLEAYHQALLAALGALGLPPGVPFFVRYSRVKVMDQIGGLLGAEAVLFACGERPGLGYSDSMSAYFIYRPTEGAMDSSREVISNINPRGIPPAAAARQTAESLARVLRDRRSGVVTGG